MIDFSAFSGLFDPASVGLTLIFALGVGLGLGHVLSVLSAAIGR